MSLCPKFNRQSWVKLLQLFFSVYTPETKRSSAEWTAAGESRSKRPKTQQLAGKVMATVFWDTHGILFIDYLEKGETINSYYYMVLLDLLSAEIKKKRPRMQKEKVLFHQGNAPCHKSIKTMVNLNELSFELLPSPTIFSRSGPQRLLALCWPEKNALVKEAYFESKDESFYKKRHRKVIEALELIYYAWRKLCWWIKSNFSKKLCFS